MAAHRKPLVVGVCEHAHSAAALRYAADRALRSREEVVAVHVRRPTGPSISYLDASGVVLRWGVESEGVAFSDTVATLGGQAPSWRYLTRRGDPARCLAAIAADIGATAIVVGHHRPWFDWLRRTVVRSLRGGPVPVVVVDSDAKPVQSRGRARPTRADRLLRRRSGGRGDGAAVTHDDR